MAIPFTPFHFGPGCLVKVFWPERFWLSSFVVANVLIDVEVLWFILHRDPPLHRLCHTYLIGLLLGLFSGVMTWLAFRWFGFQWLIKMFGLGRPDRPSSGLNSRSLSDSLMGGVIGGLSHVLLDSLLYPEMNPFWPFLSGNTLAGTVGNGLLHGICAGVGILGLILWSIQRDAMR